MTVVEWGNCAWTRPALLAFACLIAVWNPVDGSAAPPAVAASTAAMTEVREFDVLVDNKLAGTHRLSITSQGDVTTTRVESNVKINFVVYVYTYRFRATEVWRADGLTQIEVRCEDGGKKTALTAKTDGSHCQVVLNGRQHVTDRSTLTTCYWRLPAPIDQQRAVSIFDVETGLTTSGTVERIGRVTLKIEDRPIACRHFKVTGPSPAELWFDDQDRLVRQTSVEEDHPVELRLRRIREQTTE